MPDGDQQPVTVRDTRWAWAPLPLLAFAFAWAYWPTVGALVGAWTHQADYSHGFLVVPLSVAFLWFRRDLRPSAVRPARLSGMGLLTLSALVRLFGLRFTFDFLDGYSLVIWVAGAALLCLGWAYLRWLWPSLAFLLFMVPLPFQVEHLLSDPLQRVATQLSCFTLQCLGQPAFAEGTTILLGDHQLLVEQACSGLRMFVGAFALAFAFLIATRRELWEQTLLLVAVIPIALLSNSARIAATGLMFQFLSDEASVREWSHDLAGIFMIPFAAAMFAALLFYMSRLVRSVNAVGMEEMIARERG